MELMKEIYKKVIQYSQYMDLADKATTEKVSELTALQNSEMPLHKDIHRKVHNQRWCLEHCKYQQGSERNFNPVVFNIADMAGVNVNHVCDIFLS